jgi:2'-5' RNA ligase
MPAKPRRLFLALWPDAGLRAQLAALSGTLTGGRKVHPDNLHLTLVFLGTADNERLLCYEQALRDLAVPPFTLRLDRLAAWSRSGILWLGASRVPTELSNLVQELNSRLQSCGFSPERRPFQAHITLVRDFTGRMPAVELERPLVWRTEQIVLAESLQTERGVRYAVLAHWPGGMKRDTG